MLDNNDSYNPVVIEGLGITKTYGEGTGAVHALRGVNIQFNRGEFTAIMGPSGSGKSTLMHILAGLDIPTDGRVIFDGEDISHFKDNRLTKLRRQKVGFIFQSFNLLPMFTAEQNILLPLRMSSTKIDKEWYRHLVSVLQIDNRLKHHPSEMSGGQQQRVAIARALINKPSVIFADEPTGNLDMRSGAQVLHFLRDIVDSLHQTVIMVTHDTTASSYADRVTVLADGCITNDLRQPTVEQMNRILSQEQKIAANI